MTGKASTQNTRKRHVPVRNASHIYWSEKADGSRVFEVRHPRNAEGKRLYEVVGPRLDAAKARAREVHGDATPRVTSVGMTLNDVVTSWREVRQVRPRTVGSYDSNIRLHIEPRFGRVKVREIESRDIVAWANGLKLADSTKRLVLATLSVVLDHAIELGALGINPVKTIPRRQKPKQGDGRRRIITQGEELNLLAYTAPFPWLAPIIVVALSQALRLSEVLALQWRDVDFAGGKLHVRQQLGRDRQLCTTKGGKPRTIDLLPPAREALLELRLDSGEGWLRLQEPGWRLSAAQER